MIELAGITKTYTMGENQVTALNNVNLSIKEHEFVSIIGPSGSGKSTLMNILGCLDIPSSGSYVLDGSEVSEMHDDELAEIRNKKIGFIFQKYNLLPKLSAVENVELPLLYQGIKPSDIRNRAMESLKNVGLLDKMSHRPSELSGGQQQRVAIARALATKPSLLLADEPTGALDSKTGKEVMEILKSLNADYGNTIVLITHDNNLAIQAKRMVRIQDGEITEDKGLV